MTIILSEFSYNLFKVNFLTNDYSLYFLNKFYNYLLSNSFSDTFLINLILFAVTFHPQIKLQCALSQQYYKQNSLDNAWLNAFCFRLLSVYFPCLWQLNLCLHYHQGELLFDVFFSCLFHRIPGFLQPVIPSCLRRWSMSARMVRSVLTCSLQLIWAR